MRVKGLEPPRPKAPDPKSGASANSAKPAYDSCWARTSDPLIKSQLLYQLSYESYIFLWIVSQTIRTVPTGIEPAIFAVTGRRDNRYTTGPICTQAKILVKKINFLESLTLCQFPIFIRIY